MSKNKPTAFLAIKMWNFQLVLFFAHSHLFLYSIYSLQMQPQVISLSHCNSFHKKQYIWYLTKKFFHDGVPNFFIKQYILGKEALINCDNQKSTKSSIKHNSAKICIVLNILLNVIFFLHKLITRFNLKVIFYTVNQFAAERSISLICKNFTEGETIHFCLYLKFCII